MATAPAPERPRLAGTVVLVTGAQQGIGRAMALAFAGHGADVALNYLDDRAAADQVAAEIRARGRRALLLPGDVSRAADVGDMVATTVNELGPPDALVNNAGVYPRVPFLEMRESDWDHVLDVNLKGSFLCAQAVARAMVAAGRAGAIVNIASAAIRGAPLGVHYSASKGGVVSMTRAMALALAPHRIRVNAIAPGTTDTAQPRYEFSEAAMQEIGRAIPLGRLAQPADIADVAVFLVSAEARWITGETIHVNGGQHML
jgi:NAD(P)-dependent dehydrogenase (short-subunit alcohol dehydrogenase family)